MSIEQLTPERIGITAFVILYITKEVGVPLAIKIFPKLFRRSERDQDRLDNQQKFEQQMELRQVEAWEMTAKTQGEISNILAIMNERLGVIESKLDKPSRKKAN